MPPCELTRAVAELPLAYPAPVVKPTTASAAATPERFSSSRFPPAGADPLTAVLKPPLEREVYTDLVTWCCGRRRASIGARRGRARWDRKWQVRRGGCPRPRLPVRRPGCRRCLPASQGCRCSRPCWDSEPFECRCLPVTGHNDRQAPVEAGEDDDRLITQRRESRRETSRTSA